MQSGFLDSGGCLRSEGERTSPFFDTGFIGPWVEIYETRAEVVAAVEEEELEAGLEL